MKEFWDTRFAEAEYAYGTFPNEFFKQEIGKIAPGKVLLPGEGEGRNAVYAALKGFEVFAFDSSSEGKRKALELSALNKVEISYGLNSYESANYPLEYFDAIGLIFTHMPPEKRFEWHKKVARFLKPGGRIIIQGFSKEQIKNNSGGPKNIDMLFSKDELLNDFANLNPHIIKSEKINLNEGVFHQGEAETISAVFIK